MYRITAILSFLFIFTVSCGLKAQEMNMNKLSIDANIGATNAITPYATDYWSNTIGLFHTNLGARYMFNNNFGIKLDVGFDRLKNDEFGDNGASLAFSSQYIRSSFQLVANLGRFMHFENFAPRFGLFLHGGAGYSTNRNSNGPLFGSWDSPDKDNMVNFIVGLTPQIKLGSKVSLNADIALVNHIYQQRTWDLTEKVNSRGFDGLMSNVTVGISYYIGKNEEHADWTPRDLGSDEVPTNESYENRLMMIEKKMRDDDNDGIPNPLDLEKDTPAGADVDSKGRAVDNDKDGIPNEFDKCPDSAGIISLDGCPQQWDQPIEMFMEDLDTVAETNDTTEVLNTDRSGIDPVPTEVEIYELYDYQELHIVVGMFKSKLNADNYVEQLRIKGFNANIVGISKGLKVVSVGSYNEITEARAMLKRAREEIIETAWMMKRLKTY